jgi:hypothetical protein
MQRKNLLSLLVPENVIINMFLVIIPKKLMMKVQDMNI